jgi:hypothetical protein
MVSSSNENINNNNSSSSRIEQLILIKENTFITEIAYVYIMPITGLVCFLLNSLSLLVFSCSKELNDDKHYVYFKAKTIAELMLALLGMLNLLNHCEIGSTTGYLIVQVIIVYGLDAGVANIVSIFLSFMELMIVYDRYITVKGNPKLNSKIKNWTFIVCFLVISIVLNIPFLLERKIILAESNNARFYTSVRTEFVDRMILFYYWIGYTIFCSCIYVLLLPIACIALVIEFAKFTKRKNALTNKPNSAVMTNEQFDAKKNLTSMVLVLVSVFLISRLAIIFNVFYNTYLSLKNLQTLINPTLNFIVYEFDLSITAGVSFFIYIKFNRAFRSGFLSLLRKLTRC